MGSRLHVVNNLVFFLRSNGMLHFRYIAGKLLKEKYEIFKNQFKPLSVNFDLFFFKMFLCGLSEDDLDMSKERSFYLLYHPATYDAVDRIRFSHLVIEFRNR
jgi:hypothetical protein